MRLLTALFTTLTLAACGQANSSSETSALTQVYTTENQPTTMEDIYPALGKAHPKAKALMNDEWYYDPVDDMAPFGSDDAADTYAYFQEWRQLNKTASPKTFVLNHFQHWGYPAVDLESTDFNKFRPLLQENELGSRFLFGMDAAIIGTALGQLYLEGRIDSDIKAFAQTAIKRELLPELLNSWEKLKPQREKTLLRFLDILSASN